MNTACRRRASMPSAVSTSRTWLYVSEAGILLVHGNRGLHRDILFTDEAQFNRDGVKNTHKTHVWSNGNPHATVQSNLQLHYIVSVWCRDLDYQLIGPFLFEDYSSHKRGVPTTFAGGVAPNLEDVPLNKRGCI